MNFVKEKDSVPYAAPFWQFNEQFVYTQAHYFAPQE